MTVDLFLGQDKLESIFELLGDKENDITFSFGWALSRSGSFLREFVRNLLPSGSGGQAQSIHLQRPSTKGGFTDLEIQCDALHCIAEAKRGWNLPVRRQLQHYARRFAPCGSKNLLVVVSECSPEYAELHLPSRLGHIRVLYRSWAQVWRLAGRAQARASHAEKRLLGELRTYLRSLMTMQDQESNRVFVVALATKTPYWATACTSAILKKRRMYFHPFGGAGWPVAPPNYLGFRYDGRLQSVHHVERYQITTFAALHTHIPEIKKSKWERPFIVYHLGPAIRPNHMVGTGSITRAAHCWAALDLLLTSGTISSARDRSARRWASCP